MHRITFAFILCGSLFAQKRALTHQDYDAWRSIRSQQLSRDGKYLAYALFPQEGDGEFVVRNLATGKEWRQSCGQTPPPPRPDFAQAEEAPPQARGITIAFTRDSKFVVFSTFPPDAEVEKAKRAKKKPDEMPKNGLVTMELATGAAKRVDRVKSFQVPEEGGGHGGVARGAGEGIRENVGVDGARFEQRFGTEDRRCVGVHVEQGRKDAGLCRGYRLRVEPGAVAAGGREREVFQTYVGRETGRAGVCERRQQAVFMEPGGRREPGGGVGSGVAGNAGLPEGFRDQRSGESFVFERRAAHLFRLCSGCRRRRSKDDTPEDEKVSVDLWSWKDDYIQPMQKVRAEADRTRSYRAVFHIADKKLLQLADLEMPELTPSEDGQWAIGGDDRAYRAMVEYDTRYKDSYLVNTLDGSRKALAKKHVGNMSWSPDGKYALLFDGHDWNTFSVPDRKTVNLTANLGVRFWNEDHDVPGRPAAYGPAAWTKDGKWVLVNDHFDIWQIAPDGSIARNLTQGLRPQEPLDVSVCAAGRRSARSRCGYGEADAAAGGELRYARHWILPHGD